MLMGFQDGTLRSSVGLATVAALGAALAAVAGPRLDGTESLVGRAGEVESPHWVGTWAASPQLTEPRNLPPAPGFADTTLRQIAHVSIGGRTLRVRFSNAFGDEALTLLSARLARSAGASAIDAATDRALTFHGRPSVRIPAGALMVSDPLEFDLPPLSEVAVTVYVRGAPPGVTGHPGSRTTSYFMAGEWVSAAELATATRVDHWYFLSGIDVEADRQTVNRWIRTSGRFDGVIDFDAATRDPDRPSQLSDAVDGGDHLHPSAAGYRIMADAIDLSLFASGAR